jgi:UDP-N-acetylmuramyl pentapeptide synthase
MSGANGIHDLEKLAKKRLGDTRAKVIGVAGSFGNASAELIRHVLAGSFNVAARSMRCGDIEECSRKILDVPPEAEVFVFRIESGSADETARFAGNFPLTHAVITGASGRAGSRYAEAFMSTTLSALYYNRDDESLLRAAVSMENPRNAVKIRGVGFAGDEIIIKESGNDLAEPGEPELRAVISADGKEYRCRAKIFGRQNARNMAFALSLALELGVPEEKILSAMRDARLPEGAGRIYRTEGSGFMIDETLQSDPDSASHSIKDVIEFGTPENIAKLAILGGVPGLGTDSRHWHDVIMSRACLLDGVYLVGAEWDAVVTEQTSLRGRWADAAAFLDDFDTASLRGAVTLVKDSGSYDLSKIFNLAPLIEAAS